MKIAIPNWQGRVSPVFDVARDVLLVDVVDGLAQARTAVRMSEDDIQARVKTMVDLSVDVLICGAISRPLEMAVWLAGIEVFPQTRGSVEQVLAAFVSGNLNQDKFIMPGCCGLRRRSRGRGSRNGQGRAWQGKGGGENAKR